ncbi:MAG: YicC/YloC family endoribonuclease [Planctomycetaceae bacterium]
MLLSMTGFGNAAQNSELAYASVELKAVNNRYLKLSMRLPDAVARFEADLERIIREAIGRGSVQLSVRIRLNSGGGGYSINPDVLNEYVSQLESVRTQLGQHTVQPLQLDQLLMLPGVISEADFTADVTDSLWPILESTLEEALKHFDEFRRTEGESMRQDLKLQCDTIRRQVDRVAEHAPTVVSEYREKLLDRLRTAIGEAGVRVEDKDVIREVAMFADRCDINEEITRLRSHLEQFDCFLNSDRSMGRKLEFLGQEMFREINTIGSKANNVAIAHCVVDMKAAIERIREVLQNVE